MPATSYSQVFRFLHAYYQLRERTVPDITVSRRYGFTAWFSELQEISNLQNVFFSEEKLAEESVVLTLPKPVAPYEPDEPAVEEEWRPWLVEGFRGLDEVASLQEIIEVGDDLLLLESLPKLKRELEAYISQLADWKTEQKEYLAARAIYNKDKKIYDNLFQVYQQLENAPERYELLLGLGTFTHRQPPQIKRPVITLPLEITMTEKGILEIRISPDQQLFKIENDFLSGRDSFAVSAASALLEKTLAQDDDHDIWESVEHLRKVLLEQFAHQLSADAVYKKSKKKPDVQLEQPHLTFAPVLMFRERSLASFTALFEGILEQLEAFPDFRNSLLDRITGNFSTDGLPIGGEGLTNTYGSGGREETIILPKLSNAEQLKIAQRVGQENMVLVQGPPGTGKSHSIANIITHLLSQGKKVLVTAKTDQALKALQNHLPDEFLDLVVYFLSTGKRNENDLVKSVRQLQDSIDSYDQNEVTEEIAKFEKQLTAEQEIKIGLLEDIKTSKQLDQRAAYLNERYEGIPLTELTEQIISQEAAFSWFRDEIDQLEDALAEAEPFVRWHHLFKYIRNHPPAHQLAHWPDNEKLVTPATLSALEQARTRYQSSFAGKVMEATERISTSRLQNLSNRYLELRRELPIDTDWLQHVQQDFAANRSLRWKKLSTQTDELLRNITASDADTLLRTYEFFIPEEISIRQLHKDVEVVIGYVTGGKKLTGIFAGLALPKEVKERRYIFSSCRVNNHLCETRENLEVLEKYAQLQLWLTELDELWDPYIVSAKNDRRRIERYQEQGRQLKTFVDNYDDFQATEQHLQTVFGLSPTGWQQQGHEVGLTNACEAHELATKIAELEHQTQLSIQYLEQIERDPGLLEPLYQALVTANVVQYDQGYTALQDLAFSYRKIEERDNLKASLHAIFPETIHHLETQPNLTELDKETFISAIFWSHAKEELETRFSGSLDQQFKAYAHCEARIRKIALKYLKSKARKSFMDQLAHPDYLTQKLTRWTQAVRKTGGKGKRVFQYRQQAQRNLREISKYIPCWIMPMYRLVDTLSPKPEAFDVIIVDEASQLGPEALFLTYYTKKIIVVGDDQQTAPETVGIKTEQVDELIKQHLKGIPDRSFYNNDHSFFEHIDALAGKRISLREHFRCMPEIIEFSNQLCYRPEGINLIPLKQFSEHKRLKPLETYFAHKAYFDNNVNQVEAQSIANTIKYLLKEDEYKGKTFGVIALQGNYQHAEIERLLRDMIPPKAWQERQLICGTPPDFQGDERDVIFLSLVTAHNHQRTSLTKANFKRRYNVAMSRAKEQVWLFHSVREEDLKPNDLRYKLLHYFNTKRIDNGILEYHIINDRSQPAPDPFESWFEVDIYQEIIDRGYVVQPQYQVGPYRIDMVVHLANGTRVAVECDGDRYHGAAQLEQDIERQLILERAGWEFFRIRWSHYRYARAEAIGPLWGLLKSKSTQQILEQGVSSEEKKEQQGEIETKPTKLKLQYAGIRPTVKENKSVTESPPQNSNTTATPAPAPPEQEAEDAIWQKYMVDQLLFTNYARVFRSRVRASDCDQETNPEELEAGEEIIYRQSTLDYSGILVFGYRNGKMAKVPLSLYNASRSILKNAFNTEQELIFVQHFAADVDLVGISNREKVIVFNTSQISEHSSRGSQGNRVFKAGTVVERYEELKSTNLEDAEYYRRATLNSKGYYLKEGDSV